MAMLRAFQLSQTYLPVDMPAQLASLGQSLQDGLPIIVVTRGCFGRSMDYGPGPARNDTQQSVWELCRQMRAEMSQVLITCIDLPINCSSDIVQACLSEPLNEYRELMFHEGTWYTPTVIDSANLSKWRAEQKAEKAESVDMKSHKVKFNRKKFGWMNETQFYANVWTLSWKAVLEVRPAAVAPRRSDLNFTSGKPPQVRAIQDSTPSGAAATFQKVAAKAREDGDAAALLQSAKAYLGRAKPSEKASLDEAAGVAVEASKLFKSQGQGSEAIGAVKVAVDIFLFANEVEKAVAAAKEAANTAGTEVMKVQAAKLINACHFAMGDLDEALQAAKEVKEAVAAKRDAAALAEATDLVGQAYLAAGDWNEATIVAKEATGNSDKTVQARGFALLGEASNAKALQSEESAVDDAKREAAAAFEKSRALFKETGNTKEEAAVLNAAIRANLTVYDGTGAAKALALAKELQNFSGESGAMGAEATAVAHIQEYARNNSFLEGGREAMLAAAMQAVSLSEQAGDASRKAAAQRVLAEARRTGRGSL